MLRLNIWHQSGGRLHLLMASYQMVMHHQSIASVMMSAHACIVCIVKELKQWQVLPMKMTCTVHKMPCKKSKAFAADLLLTCSGVPAESASALCQRYGWPPPCI